MGDDDRQDSNSVSRRTMLKRMGIAGAVAWVTPVVTSLNTPAFAASGPTGNCSPGGTCASGFVQCGAVGTACFCFTTPTGAGCGALRVLRRIGRVRTEPRLPTGFHLRDRLVLRYPGVRSDLRLRGRRRARCRQSRRNERSPRLNSLRSAEDPE